MSKYIDGTRIVYFDDRNGSLTVPGTLTVGSLVPSSITVDNDAVGAIATNFVHYDLVRRRLVYNQTGGGGGGGSSGTINASTVTTIADVVASGHLLGQETSQIVDYDFTQFGTVWGASFAVGPTNGVALSATGKYQVATIAGGGLSISSDYGRSFTGVAGFPYSVILPALSASGQYVYAGYTSGGPIFASSNYGSTFQILPNSPFIGWNSVSCSADGRYILGGPNTSQYPQLSIDFGATWSPVVLTQASAFTGISATGQTMAVGTSTGSLYYTRDFGANWFLAAIPSANWTAVAVSGNGQTITVGGTLSPSSHVLYSSNNYGATWILQQTSASPWTQIGIDFSGLRQVAASQTIYSTPGWTSANVDGDTATGVALSANGQYAAAGTLGGNFYLSLLPTFFPAGLEATALTASTIYAPSLLTSNLTASTIYAPSLLASTFITQSIAVSSIGINCNTPQFTLDVDGSANIQHNLYVPAIGTSSITASTFVAGSAFVPAIGTDLITTSTLLAVFAFAPVIGTSSMTASTLAVANSLFVPAIGTSSMTASTLAVARSLFVPAIGTSSMTASTLLAVSAIVPVIGTSSMTASTFAVANSLFVPAIGTSSMTASTLAVAGSLFVPALGTSSITASTFAVANSLFVPVAGTSSVTASTLAVAGSLFVPAIGTSSVTASTLAVANSLFVPVAGTSSVTASTLAVAGSLFVPVIGTSSVTTSTLFAVSAFAPALQASSITTSTLTVGTANVFSFAPTTIYDSIFTNFVPQLNVGSSNFTMECFFYPTATPVTWGTILSLGTVGFNGHEFRITQRIDSGGFGMIVPLVEGVSDQLASLRDPLPLNVWYHLALVRSGNTVSLYSNGISVSTMTTNYSLSEYHVLNLYNNPYIYDPIGQGYLNSVRVITNQALYTGNFTPSFAPLTATSVGTSGANVATSITGTVAILTAQTSNFIDVGPSALALATSGFPTAISSPSPFTTIVSRSGTTSLNGTMNLSGTMNFNGTANFNGITSVSSNLYTPILMTSSITASTLFARSLFVPAIGTSSMTASTFAVANSLFVPAIGTSSITASTLAVAGDARFNGAMNVLPPFNNILINSGLQQILLANGTAVTAPYLFASSVSTGTARIRVGAYSNASPMPLTFNENGGFVGINCNAPAYQLDVNGKGTFTGGGFDALTVTGTVDSNPACVRFLKPSYTGYVGWAGNGILGPASCNIFTINTGTTGTSIALMPASGNVGVNCNAPRYVLDVNGTANFNGAVTISNIPQTSILLPNSPLNATLVTSALQQRLLTTQGYSTGIYMQATTSNCIMFAYGQTTPIPFILQPVSGNVGINTTNPQYTLDVNGTANITGAATFASPLNLKGASTETFFGTAATIYNYNTAGNIAGEYRWYTSRTTGGGLVQSTLQLYSYFGADIRNPLHITPAGNVGIAIAPVYALDVFGSIRASGNMYASGSIAIGSLSFDIPFRIDRTAGGYSYPTFVNSAYQFINVAPGAGNFGGATATNISMYSAGDIWCAGARMVVSSDERIKQNITPLLFDSTCQLLQKITPVSYTFKDITKSGTTHVGFIAQAVEEICPNAVTRSTEYIPNINTIVSTITTNSTVTSYLQISSTLLSSIVQFYTPDNKKIKGTIVSISSNSFDTSMESSVDNYSTLLCQGTYVNDFRVLDKDYIYTLNVTATKNLMELVEQQGSTIQGIQQELRALRG